MRTNKLRTKKHRRNRRVGKIRGGETSLERAQHKAATKIQGLTRGKFTRKYLPQIKEYRLQKKEEARALRRRWANSPRQEVVEQLVISDELSPRRKSTSARKIQGLFRGQLTRRYLPQIKADRLAHRLHKKSEAKRLRKLWTDSPGQLLDEGDELDLSDIFSDNSLSNSSLERKKNKAAQKIQGLTRGRFTRKYLPQIKAQQLQKKADAKALRRRWANSPSTSPRQIEPLNQINEDIEELDLDDFGSFSGLSDNSSSSKSS